MNTLYVMCGIPASGKTTFAKKLADCGCEYVGTDEIRKELFGDESIQTNGQKVFDLAFHRITLKALEEKNVVFDATNRFRKDRKELIKKFRPYFDYIMLITFPCSLETCLDRNSKRPRQVPKKAIERMHLQYECPIDKEGFDEILEIKF